MTAPVIPTLPTAPSRNDAPDTFVARADAHVAALTPWTTAANSLGTYLDALGTAADAGATTATTQAGIATTQATLAADWATKTSGTVDGSEYSAKKYATDAATSASTATNSPGTQATSTTSITIGTGSKSFTLAQTGKVFTVGQWVTVARTSAPAASYLVGPITAFNSGTGAITIDAVTTNGSGTFTDWTITQGSPVYKYGLTSIGSIRLDIEKGTTVAPTIDDISTYLRSGTTATVATYPTAVGKGIDCYGTATGGVSTSYAGDIAHNGSNTLVATTAASNSVSVSTDGGATWAATAVGLSGVNIVGVRRVGSRFIVFGNSGLTLKLAYSTNGTSWTAGATQALFANAQDQISAETDGTTLLIVPLDGGTSVYTTTDGTSLTTRTIPAVLGGAQGTRVACLPSLGANQWLISGQSVTTAYRSTASDGSAWSAAQTLPVMPNSSMLATGNKFIIVKSGILYYSSTGLTGSWTTVTLPTSQFTSYGGKVDTSVGGKCQAYYDGTRLWVGATLGTATTSIAAYAINTTDLTTFATWNVIQCYQTFSGLVTKGAGIAPVVCGTNLVFMKIEGGDSGSNYGNASTSTPTYVQQTSWASGPARVGLTIPVTLDYLTSSYWTDKLVGYVRVA